MARHKREPLGKKINPTFYIFCEGESEESYINYLRSKYRLPIEIFAKITGNRINDRLIRDKIKNSFIHKKDKIYFMYDIDVEGFLDKLQKIQIQFGSELLISNPCFELWYILHFNNQTAEIKSEPCLKKLMQFCHDYEKGGISTKLKSK